MLIWWGHNADNSSMVYTPHLPCSVSFGDFEFSGDHIYKMTQPCAFGILLSFILLNNQGKKESRREEG